jgi:hypothetical protein
MFKIDRYLNFLLENKSSGKMKIYYTERLRELFKDIKFMDPGNIVSILLHIENKSEYLDKYTLIDISEDKNDYLTFIQVNRILRNSDIEGISLSKEIIDSGKNYLSNYRTEVGLGRWVSRVMLEVYDKQMLPSQVSRLVDFYRSVYDEKYDEESLFEIVKGEDIKKWYNENNYDKKVGQLGNSCMRYEWCEDFFDIYVENPEVCSLLLMYNQAKSKIIARSLLWKLTNGKIYQDRIYSNYDSDMFKVKNWAVGKGYLVYEKYENTILEVKVKPKKYENYPYMDTFVCYNPELGILSSDESLWPGQGFIKLQDSEGGFTSDNVVYSNYHDEFIEKEQAVYAIGLDGEDYFKRHEVYQIDGKYYFEDLTTYSSYHDRVLLLDDSVYSDLLNDSLDPNNENVIEVIIDKSGNTDWSVLSRPDTWIKEGNLYYHSDEYIYDPYEQKRRFLDDSDKEYLKEEIKKELNITKSNMPIDIVKKVYETNDYNKEELINQIKNNKIFIEKIKGIYWGFTPDKIPTANDLYKGVFAYIVDDNKTSLHNIVGKLFGKEDEIYFRNLQYRNISISYILQQIYSSIEYEKVSNIMYKLFLYKIL